MPRRTNQYLDGPQQEYPGLSGLFQIVIGPSRYWDKSPNCRQLKNEKRYFKVFLFSEWSCLVFLVNNSLLEFHETSHSVTFYFMKKDSKRCCDTTTPGSIRTKDESKSGSAFAFIFGVN